MEFTKTNSLGEKVIPASRYFYTKLANESFVCCGELQNVMYCFANNIAQGCGMCEFDYTQPCECAVCER